MSAYCIFDIKEIHDPAAMEDYRSRVPDTVAAHGGDYLSIGGPWQVMEGSWRPSFPVIIAFPTMEDAQSWYRSDDYADLLELRQAATTSDAVFIESL